MMSDQIDIFRICRIKYCFKEPLVRVECRNGDGNPGSVCQRWITVRSRWVKGRCHHQLAVAVRLVTEHRRQPARKSAHSGENDYSMRKVDL
ncbi:hypothetical protein KCP75_12515 [Salmonella enterica subsp. enterica]|nr:hypothetical protein KCP75_12515 [Salmonella enterica subsp. enterica]